MGRQNRRIKRQTEKTPVRLAVESEKNHEDTDEKDDRLGSSQKTSDKKKDTNDMLRLAEPVASSAASQQTGSSAPSHRETRSRSQPRDEYDEEAASTLTPDETFVGAVRISAGQSTSERQETEIGENTSNRGTTATTYSMTGSHQDQHLIVAELARDSEHIEALAAERDELQRKLKQRHENLPTAEILDERKVFCGIQLHYWILFAALAVALIVGLAIGIPSSQNKSEPGFTTESPSLSPMPTETPSTSPTVTPIFARPNNETCTSIRQAQNIIDLDDPDLEAIGVVLILDAYLESNTTTSLTKNSFLGPLQRDVAPQVIGCSLETRERRLEEDIESDQIFAQYAFFQRFSWRWPNLPCDDGGVAPCRSFFVDFVMYYYSSRRVTAFDLVDSLKAAIESPGGVLEVPGVLRVDLVNVLVGDTQIKTDEPTASPSEAPTGAPLTNTQEPTLIASVDTSRPTNPSTETGTSTQEQSRSPSGEINPTESPQLQPAETKPTTLTPTVLGTIIDTLPSLKPSTTAPIGPSSEQSPAPQTSPSQESPSLITPAPSDESTQIVQDGSSTAGSAQPVMSPTKRPTILPTNSPSVSPTMSPSARPTEMPTLAPTPQPTTLPSIPPTIRPTAAPTQAASSVTDEMPKLGDDLQPLSNPTPLPTQAPIESLSASPTKSPTETPTESPSASPTKRPTETPTESPSASPTKSPTETPTTLPTNGPSKSPTVIPSSNPTTNPTKAPTKTPTNSPTKTPTKEPTTSPTKSPSASPTICTEPEEIFFDGTFLTAAAEDEDRQYLFSLPCITPGSGSTPIILVAPAFTKLGGSCQKLNCWGLSSLQTYLGTGSCAVFDDYEILLLQGGSSTIYYGFADYSFDSSQCLDNIRIRDTQIRLDDLQLVTSTPPPTPAPTDEQFGVVTPAPVPTLGFGNRQPTSAPGRGTLPDGFFS